jgi:uncharacterized protein (TIGR03083 family)
MFDVATARALTRRELEGMTRSVSRLGEADWQRPSRCVGWSVADVCSHAALAAFQMAEAFRRAAKGLLRPPERPGAPQLATSEIVGLLIGGARALDGALATLPAQAVDGMTPMPFGVAPTRMAIQLPVYEYAFHADDVREAIGAGGTFPADIAAAFIQFLPRLAPLLAGGAEPGQPEHAYRLAATSGTITLAHSGDDWAAVNDTNAPLCTISGPDSAIALFAMGRARPDDPRLAVSGPVPTAAAGFKRWFPGP